MLDRRVDYHPILVSACLLILVYVFAGRQIADLWHGQADSVGHIESVSLSLYGRFHGAALVTDAYSGEFPTFYNFLSDWLINLIAYATGLPPFLTQAVIYVPLLTVLIFLGTYLSIRAIEVERGVALLGAVLVVGSAETAFVHYLYPLLEGFSGLHAATGNVIPPAESIGVASSQILGWALFLPILAALYCAKRRGGWQRAFFAGALLGIGCLVHTLTFLHVATTVSVYVAVDAIATRIRQGRTVDALARSAAIVVLTMVIARVSQRTGVSMLNFAIYWSGCFALSLIDLRSLRFAVVYGFASLLFASPFLLQIWQLGLQGSVFQSYDSPLPKTDFVLFYLGYIACVVVVFLNARRLKRSDSLIWLAVMLIVSIGLGYGKIFGFQSHEYRFLTNAIIPFAVISALVLALPPSVSRKVAVFVLVPLLLIGVVRNLWAIRAPLPAAISQTVGGFQNYNGVIPLPPGAPALLDRLRVETAKLSPGSRLLLPPEYEYPQQAYRNGLLLAVSRVPGFIPDPRYILWHDLYADRVAVFCSLFPAYRHFDGHTQVRLCDETPKELAPGHLALVDVRAAPDVLPLYRIGPLASLQGAQDGLLAEQAARLGMKPIYDANGGMIWQTTAEPDQDRLSFGAASYREPDFSIPVAAPWGGAYLVVLAGKAISTRVRQIRLGQTVIEPRPLGEDAIAVLMELPMGSSQLTLALATDQRLRIVFPTPIRLIVGIRREAAERYLAGPSLQGLLR
jgi:hypothetical protein